MTRSRRIAGSALVTLHLLLAPGLALALLAPPAGSVLPDFDSRAKLQPADGLAARASAAVTAVERLAATAATIQVTWNASGTVRWLHAAGQPLATTIAGDPETRAREFLAGHGDLFGLVGSDLANFEVSFVDRSSSGVTHVGFAQQVDGIRLFRGGLRVDLDDAGRVIAAAATDIRPRLADRAQPRLSPQAAVASAANALGWTIAVVPPATEVGARVLRFAIDEARSPVSLDLVWFPVTASARLAWRARIDVRGYPAYYQILVDATTGELLYRENLMRYAETFGNVFTNNPNRGGRSLQRFYDDAVNVRLEWPSGWLYAAATDGNTVAAREDRDGNDLSLGAMVTATAGPPQVFDPAYTVDVFADMDLAIVNLFWGNNRMHEHLYGLGFDEAAGNFQEDNFGRGGTGGDPVQADAQDSGDTLLDADTTNDVKNNANFATQGDGIPPRMQMYLFDLPGTWVDSDLDMDVVFHEYCHGLSNRLVGGRTDAGCLFGVQDGAMGEAWGDWFAGSMSNDPVMGEYSTGDPVNGIRTAPMNADNYTYGDLCQIAGAGTCEVHADGEIWAQALWEARSAMRAAHGAGNGTQMIEQLVVDGMKFSICNPSFLAMRDAILLADQTRYAGANHCLLWQVFAESGMGFAAQDQTGGDEQLPIEDFTLPLGCATPPGGGVLSWQFAEYGCDSTGVVTVLDPDLALPVDVIITSTSGDSETLALAASGAGPPAYTTAPFPIASGAVTPGDGIVQGAPGDSLVASYFDATAGADRTATVDLRCAADVEILSYRFREGTCDDDTVPGFPQLPGFLDAGESAILEIELANQEPFPLEDAMVTLSSSNPLVSIDRTTPMPIGTLGPRLGTATAPQTIRFLLSADPSVTAFDTADLTLDFSARGYNSAATPLTWTIRLNLDYATNPRSFTEDFEPTSPTLGAWGHQPTLPTPTLDQWQVVTCQASTGVQSYKNGGGDPGCGNYSDGQGNPVLFTPPLDVLGAGVEAARLVTLSYDHHVQMARPRDPTGFCDADAIGVLLTNDPTTIDTTDPFSLIASLINFYTVVTIPPPISLTIDSNTTGFVTETIDLSLFPLPGLDLTRPVFASWVFVADYTNPYDPVGFCGFFNAEGEGYYLDDMRLDWEEVVAVAQSTTCVTTCKTLAVSDPPAATFCPGSPLTLDGSPSLTIECAVGALEYRWSGGELGPGSWGLLPTASVNPTGPTRYTLEAQCGPNCGDSVEVLVVPASAPPAGGPVVLLMAKLPGMLHLDWTATPMAPRAYNVHEASVKGDVADTMIGAQPLVAAPTDSELVDLTDPGANRLYEVFGRDGCTNLSVIP